jgi:hypothetical protein
MSTFDSQAFRRELEAAKDDPQELQQLMLRKQQEMDVALARKLTVNLGMSKEEAASAMRPDGTEAERKGRQQAALEAGFLRQLDDPNSQLADLLIEQAVRELGDPNSPMAQHIAELERQAKARKRKRNLLMAAALVASAVACLAFFLLRGKNACLEVVGTDKLSALLGQPLTRPFTTGSLKKDGACSASFEDPQQPMSLPVELLDHTSHGYFERQLTDSQWNRFARRESIALGDDAMLFVAPGEAAPHQLKQNLDEALAAPRRRGLGLDPMSAALAKLPPNQHTVLVRKGDVTAKLQFHSKTWSVEAAQQASALIAARLPDKGRPRLGR